MTANIQIVIGVFIVAGFFLNGCSQISLNKKQSHNLIKTPVAENQRPAVSDNSALKAINLSGNWKVGFRYQGKTETGSMQLKQVGQSFTGAGKENNGLSFRIDHGSIKDNEIIFLKRYDKSPDQSVQYHGQFSILSSENGAIPYMGGDFSLERNGIVSTGDWEAAKEETVAQEPINSERQRIVEQKASVSAEDNKNSAISLRTPDLSGKWEAAFEYNFKTIHSVMFLEQVGSKLSGHGMDTETKDKFVIKKGWYYFPHITIVRQYLSDKRVIPEREMTFKADVTTISEKDYSGPYLIGKTQGGGSWEAQRIY